MQADLIDEYAFSAKILENARKTKTEWEDKFIKELGIGNAVSKDGVAYFINAGYMDKRISKIKYIGDVNLNNSVSLPESGSYCYSFQGRLFLVGVTCHIFNYLGDFS